ncbi:hypothetical protein ACFSCX_06185 [Bacillus salitolerans]|uniref:Uncharacterized protein n=1 Tax=Bacillus salitolerans TaxID=1437434 RepID=A0ABW4LPX3_9BACI
MLNFSDTQEIADFTGELGDEFLLKNRRYQLLRVNEGLSRSNLSDLTGYTYRNEEEHHNVTCFYSGDKIEFVESGYGMS